MKKDFFKKGLEVEVKDGYVYYCFKTFFTEAYMRNCEISLEDVQGVDGVDELIETSRIATEITNRQKGLIKNLRWRIGVKHSWGILPKEKYLIDYHRWIEPAESPFPIFEKFPTLKGIRIRKFLMIIPLRKLPVESGYLYKNVIYMEKATQKEDVIHYPLEKYSTKLRI